MSKKDQRTAEEFNTYMRIRQEINNFVIHEYGYYYLQPDQTKARWLGVIPYKPELVEQLLKLVTNFLNFQTHSKNPGFMLHVITDIAYYLSEYAIKNPESINRNQTAKALKQKLMDANAVLQGRLKTTKQEKTARKRTVIKQAKQVHGQVNDLFREMQDDFRHHWCR